MRTANIATGEIVTLLYLLLFLVKFAIDQRTHIVIV